MFGLLAGATVVAHFAALLYIGLGGFLAWKWPRSILLHVFFAVWGVIVNLAPVACPLTALENYFRVQEGLGPLPGGFNEYYIFGTIVPDDMVDVVAVGALAVLTSSYVGAYVLWRNRKRTDLMVLVK
ncbi:DUF2784 domain-containing protein [Actinokineospora auranticolor]|uniref:Uncharacterized protein DUF2784 n=1 Tax=Actinokineospora auranticolor TaxID=155976 RepID=A0A2S6GRY9_9PSEU|nr:DUF2784 domain-containing protein [Actinokineospora auranticolor]PPK67937.1 uncharacterized protein DUF2784 [Actinokineospora auranticolor]